MWIRVKEEKDKVKKGKMIVCLSTAAPQYRELYSQARELGSYLLRKIEFDEVCRIYSSSFGPEVIVEGGIARLPECIISASRNYDFFIVTGDTSPTDMQYEFSDALLSIASEHGVKEVYSIGARWAEPPLQPDAEPEVKGFASDEAGTEILRQKGVKIISNEPAPFFANMIVAIARKYNIKAFKLSVDHGEPRPHYRSVMKLIRVLTELVGFEVSLDEIEQRMAQDKQRAQGSSGPIYR